MQLSLSLQKTQLTLKRLKLTVIHLQCLFTLYDTVCDGRHIIVGNTELELPTEPTIVDTGVWWGMSTCWNHPSRRWITGWWSP